MTDSSCFGEANTPEVRTLFEVFPVELVGALETELVSEWLRIMVVEKNE